MPNEEEIFKIKKGALVEPKPELKPQFVFNVRMCDLAAVGILDKLYLDPEKRGKGMGLQLMNWIKDWTKSKSLGQIDLYVMQENKPAIQFYLKEGFEITGEFLEKFDSGEVEYNHIMSYSF